MSTYPKESLVFFHKKFRKYFEFWDYAEGQIYAWFVDETDGMLWPFYKSDLRAVTRAARELLHTSEWG